MRYVISLGGPDLANGLRLSLGKTPGLTVVEIPLPKIALGDQVGESIVTAFSQVADGMESLVAAESCSGLLNAIAVIDFWDDSLKSLAELNPISSTAGPLSALVAMLLLAFPEVHWCFNTNHAPLNTFLFCDLHMWHAFDHPGSASRVCGLNELGFVPLFDPMGVRNMIRKNMRMEEENGILVAPDIPARPQLAAVIEEEKSYAHLHAYIAYKFGFRVNLITSFGMMKRFLRGIPIESSETAVCENALSLLFEDLYLNFPDRDPGLRFHLSRLSDRDQQFSCLASVRRRVIITTGHHGREEDNKTREVNNQYIKSLNDNNGFVRMVFKPGAGVFDIWTRSGLAADLPNGGRARAYKLSQGRIHTGGGHSCPGRLLAIAERLIGRSRRLLLEGSTVTDSIYSAVLALEAQEYLGERTPTTSLEALALKHEAEVVAESMFYGVQYNIDIESRFEELEKEVSSVGEWFLPETRKISVLNAEIRILSRLLRSFRDNGQFDEEQKSLIRIRKLHRRLWCRKNRWWSWAVWFPRLYVEFLLESVSKFACALAFWVTLFAGIYIYLLHTHVPAVPGSGLHGLTDAVTAFFGMQPPHDFNGLVEEYSHHATTAIIVTLSAIGASFVHLGIFISHLYSIVSRR